LGYSESDAIRRVRAARAIRKFPSILQMIARGELHLVGVSMLEPFLTSENHRGLLSEARRKSQREIEKITARLIPVSAEPRDRIRILPAPAKSLGLDIKNDGQVPASAGLAHLDKGQELLGIGSQVKLDSGSQNDVKSIFLNEGEEHSKALAPVGSNSEPGRNRRLFTFAAGEPVYRLFLQARDLLRHRFPQGRMEEIIGEALRRLVEQELPRKPKKQKTNQPASSRRIPLWVQEEVWRHDGGKCSYIGPSGIRCKETGWLEFDHIIPWALGGRSDDPGNIRLLCRAHNQAEARRVFNRSRGASQLRL
jgi:hypothetical protein